jgi:hypothetical protein
LSDIKPNIPWFEKIDPRIYKFLEIINQFYNTNKKIIWTNARIYLYSCIILRYFTLLLLTIVIGFDMESLFPITDFFLWTYRFWTMPAKKILIIIKSIFNYLFILIHLPIKICKSIFI